MRNIKGAITGIFAAVILFSGVNIYAQAGDCKVLLPSLEGSYTGQCKKGLAQGKGIARGIDHYEGQFSKGLPEGRGTYTWADGSVFNGQWEKGLMEGEGRMVYPRPGGDSVVTGYWKKDKYAGKEFIAPYTVIRKVGVLSYSFRKIDDTGSDVIMRFLMGGQINSRLNGFSLTNDSGSQYKSGPKVGIQNIFFPFEMKVSYTTSNPISRASFEVFFECIINEPGRWEVTINN